MDAMSDRQVLHIEVLLTPDCPRYVKEELCTQVTAFVNHRYVSLRVGELVTGYDHLELCTYVKSILVAEYVGPETAATYHTVAAVWLEIHFYALHAEQDADPRKRSRCIGPSTEGEQVETRVLRLPNVVLDGDWASLVYDDAMPAHLLRMFTRMLDIMRQPGINSRTFNWNRLCLLHGSPGSGKSTLCRALSQKLSIRLSGVFPNAVLFEVNCNTMLSRYFGQSGKLIDSLFQRVMAAAQSVETLVCVMMDEIETIAGHRERSAGGMDCRDALRATNQLLTGLDRLRGLPNIIVLCTSNLASELDPAFLDRVDKKILVPDLSPAAVYAILRSCLNELVDNGIIDHRTSSIQPGNASKNKPSMKSPAIPVFNEMAILCFDDPASPARSLWEIAQTCHGFSGRLLRRLPILALAEHTWRTCSLSEAIRALKAAVDTECTGKQD